MIALILKFFRSMRGLAECEFCNDIAKVTLTGDVMVCDDCVQDFAHCDRCEEFQHYDSFTHGLCENCAGDMGCRQ